MVPICRNKSYSTKLKVFYSLECSIRIFLGSFNRYKTSAAYHESLLQLLSLLQLSTKLPLLIVLFQKGLTTVSNEVLLQRRRFQEKQKKNKNKRRAEIRGLGARGSRFSTVSMALGVYVFALTDILHFSEILKFHVQYINAMKLIIWQLHFERCS